MWCESLVLWVKHRRAKQFSWTHLDLNISFRAVRGEIKKCILVLLSFYRSCLLYWDNSLDVHWEKMREWMYLFPSHLMYLCFPCGTHFSEKQTMFPICVGEPCFIREHMWENKMESKNMAMACFFKVQEVISFCWCINKNK